MMEKTLQCRRRAIDRHAELLAEDLDGQVHILDTCQHAWYQIACFIGCPITPIGHLIVSSTINIVEDRPWQALLRKLPEILEVVAVRQVHVKIP